MLKSTAQAPGSGFFGLTGNLPVGQSVRQKRKRYHVSCHRSQLDRDRDHETSTSLHLRM
jgi:hypothetical protein